MYRALLEGWAPRLDLISPGDLSRVRERHIEDSLRALPLVTEVGNGWCIDVGSGAGLPGIPLAIGSGLPWRLLEPRKRRAAFLEEALRELELDQCEVVVRTAQQAALDPALRAAHSVATARALAPPADAAALCRPLVRATGHVILLVGSSADIPRDAEEIEPGLIRLSADASESGNTWK